MTDPSKVGQPQQLPISAGLVLPNNRTGLRPIVASSGSQVPRQLIGQPLYLLNRPPQPNVGPPRSQQLNHQTNGAVGIQPQIRPATAQSSDNEVSISKFLNHILTTSKGAPRERGQVIKLIQDLIDDRISCDDFLTQLYIYLKTTRRQDVDNLFYSGLNKFRMELINGTTHLPYINPPGQNRNPSSVASATSTQSNLIAPSPAVASHILPRPPVAEIPLTSTFQLTSQSIPITPAPLRPISPLVQTSNLSPRVAINSPIAPSTPIRQIRPAPSGNQLRLKAPATLFQSVSGATSNTPIAPHRATVLAPGTPLRSLYPSPAPGSVASLIATAPPPPPSNPLVSVPVSSNLLPAASTGSNVITSNTISTPQIATSQNNQPFFPVSQIRSFLGTKLSAGETASLTEDALNCMAHGLNSFLRDILTRISLVVGHKTTKLAEDPHLVQVDYKREQIAFVQRMHEFDQEKRTELQRELILKAAKTRMRNENSDQAKLREMANQLKNEKDERERQEQANFTALSAIGALSSKRPRLSLNTSASEQGIFTPGSNLSNTLNSPSLLNTNPSTSASSTGLSLINSSSSVRLVQSSSSGAPKRFDLAASLRTRRAGLREVQVVLSKDRRLCRSRALCKTYWH